MAYIGEDFNAEDHEPQQVFDVLPVGKYLAYVSSSDVKPTKKNDGTMLWLELTVADGPYKNRKIFDRITLTNPNQQAVDIGKRQLSALCHAVGKLRITDSAELHDLPCVVSVKIEHDESGKYDDKNVVKGYSREGETEKPATTQKPATAGATNGGGSKPPWARK